MYATQINIYQQNNTIITAIDPFLVQYILGTI